MSELELYSPDGDGDEKISLPSGGWITIRDPKTFRARDKKQLMRGMKGTPQEVGPGVFGVDMTDGIVTAMITAWEVPYLPGAPIPAQQPDIIDDLEIADYDCILESADQVRKVLFPAPVSPDDWDKPESPTQPVDA